MDSLPDDVRQRVRAARAYAGFSLDGLAEAVELGRQTVIRIERGKRDPKRRELREIAAACGLPYEFFTADFTRLHEISDAATQAGLPALPGALGQKHLEPEHESGRRRPRQIRPAADERPGSG